MNIKQALVQVKSGHVNSPQVRDLRGTVERENAPIGIFITLELPTRDMYTEAAKAGKYRSEFWQQEFPKIQLYTVEELLRGVKPQLPPAHGTFQKAPKAKKVEGRQGELEI